jgi:hypothetical protein
MTGLLPFQHRQTKKGGHILPINRFATFRETTSDRFNFESSLQTSIKDFQPSNRLPIQIDRR